MKKTSKFYEGLIEFEKYEDGEKEWTRVYLFTKDSKGERKAYLIHAEIDGEAYTVLDRTNREKLTKGV